MDEVKRLLKEGKVTPDQLREAATCPSCPPTPLTLDQVTKDQRSEAWLKAREGRVTASDCAAICVSSAHWKWRAKNRFHADHTPG